MTNLQKIRSHSCPSCKVDLKRLFMFVIATAMVVVESWCFCQARNPEPLNVAGLTATRCAHLRDVLKPFASLWARLEHLEHTLPWNAQHAAKKWMMIDMTHTHTTSYISYISYYTMLHHTTAHTVDTYVYYVYRYRYYIPVSQTNLPHEPAAGVWTDQTIAGTKGKESSWGVVATSLAGPSRPWSWTFYRGNDHRRWREREREKDKERQRMLWLYAKVFQVEAAMQHCTEIETAMNYHLHPSTSIYMYFICTYFTSISHPFQSSILISIYSNFTSICIHL